MDRAIRDGVKEMLSYALAIAVALSSLVLFSTAFLMSDIHRQDDFLWSGVGLFYALVLWFCARNITGAVLLGQTAAATLVVSYSWQTLKLRKAVANPEQAPAINNFSLLKAANGLLKRQRVTSQPKTSTSQITAPEKVTDKPVEIPEAVVPSSSAKKSTKTKSDRFGRFFGKQQKSNISNTKLDEILEENNPDEIENVAKKSTGVTKTETVKPSMPEKVEPIQPVEKNLNAAKSSPPSEPEPQPTTTPQFLEDRDISISEEAKANPVKNSTDSVRKPQTETKKQSVAVTPEVAKSAPIPENQSQVLNQEVSEVEDSQIEQKNSAEFQSKSQIEDISDNSVDISQSNTQAVKPSVLDSLETVEVAEVLEALPEDTGSNRGQGEENIIEVPTSEISEINIASEVTKIDPNQDHEGNAEE